MNATSLVCLCLVAALLPCSCSSSPARESAADPRFGIYAPVKLEAELGHLSTGDRQMIGLLVEAAKAMDELFWLQAWGDREALLARIEDPAVRRFAEINYGPWDRLDDDRPFVEGVGAKPAGANLYPADMTSAEYDALDDADKASPYTVLRRDDAGALVVVPYSREYEQGLRRAAGLLRRAAELSSDRSFADYLRLRAEALLSDDYLASDMAWMDMKTNPVELVIGPIETYEDGLYGSKAAFEAYVLVKDQAWSERLERFAAFLPDLQRGLPVEDAYKQETPGGSADLNAYDALYYAGDCNAGAKTIAINLPNDERVQLAKGTRRLQLKNAMRAKFERILEPISDVLIAPEQRAHITFDAFFANTMFHEVAHGLGIKNTIAGESTVREALKEHFSPIEEGKADILGLYMITALTERGELEREALMDNYVTFLAGIFRSVRFGASSAHGRANMVRFNFFREQGAFVRDEASGTYAVDFEAMQAAVTSLSRLLLTLQGDGDYAGVSALLDSKGVIDARLQADLDRLAAAAIPVDIVFEP